MLLFFTIMIGILQWMPKQQTELIVLVEPKTYGFTGWSLRERLKKELSKEHNKNRMFSQQYMQVEYFKEINLNPKKLWSSYLIKVK